MRKLIFFLATLFPTTMVFTQAPDSLWTKIYGGTGYEEGWQVIETSDGGLAIVGSTQSFGNGNWDVWLIKTDSNGDTLWTKTYGYPQEDQGRSIKETPDHGFIIAGFSWSYIAETEQAFLIKTDSLGHAQWIHAFGDSTRHEARSVDLTPDGGFIMAGWKNNRAGDRQEVLLIKTDSLGNLIWEQSYVDFNFSEKAWAVKSTSDDGFIIAGWAEHSAYIIKTDNMGDIAWTRYLSILNGIVEARSVIEVSDGFVIGCRSQEQWADAQGRIYKLALSGQVLWYKIISPSYSVNSIVQIYDGSFILGGFNYINSQIYQAYLAETDSLGDQIWIKTYGRAGNQYYGHSAIQTSDGGFVLVGTSMIYDWPLNLFLTKLAPDEFESTYDDSVLTPSEIALFPAYPNPFNAQTTIKYNLPKSSSVLLDIYDITGRKIETLQSDFQLAGEQSIVWNAGDNPSGVYFYRLKSGVISKTEKCILLK